jgi:para-nitrobenzyl esterase
MADGTTIRIKQGQLRGERGDGFRVFRGIPYAAPPERESRFAPPAQAPAWSGERDATADRPIAPQNRSRLAHIMGDFAREQSEDCLNLTIWSPENPAGPCPVLVWIHGGAFTTGAGSLAWYSGESFARSGLVVVGINYRIGVLGFLSVPGASPGNLGLLDQVAALRWVRDNIQAFGGDPRAVTVMGQSAGGGSIGALLAMPSATGLFHRAIMQSAALQRVNPSPDAAAQAGRRLFELVGVPPDHPGGLRDVPVKDLLAAQGELARLEKRFADPVTPFRPVLDGRVITKSPVMAARDGAAKAIDVLIGTTREEMAAFYSIDDSVRNAGETALRAEFERLFGARGGEYCEEYRRARLDTRPAALLGDLYSDRLFRIPSLQFAEAQAAHGRPAYVYQFDWQSPAGFAACHCLELPFVFDNLDHWRDAPMLAGADPAPTARLARIMQRAWAAFALRGDPNHAELPAWQPYDVNRRMTMRFDTVVEPVGDLAGRSWRLPWPT